MRPLIHRSSLVMPALIAMAMLPPRLAASDDRVVAVLSSASGPYQQAFEGFQQAFGHSISYTLSEVEPNIPSDTRVIVAIGGKAALYPYPSGHLLIYCMTPGTKVTPQDYHGRLLIVHTSPSLYRTVAQFKEFQPALKRLAIVWGGDSIQDLVDQEKDIANRLGVELVSTRIRNSAELPDRLRAMKGKVDAIWMPPDAIMATPANFTTMKEFSLGNGIPYYVPNEGMVEQGATASVSASFKDIGALAAQMTSEGLNGSLTTDRVYPTKIHFSINLPSAEACHLNIPAAVLQKADRVIS